MAKTTQQRRNEIYRIIVSQGSARVSELAEQLQVTTETIRKDLNSMDEQGIIIKNHGGAEIKKHLLSAAAGCKNERACI